MLQGDSIERGPQIFCNTKEKKTTKKHHVPRSKCNGLHSNVRELTEGYVLQDEATCHTLARSAALLRSATGSFQRVGGSDTTRLLLSKGRPIGTSLAPWSDCFVLARVITEPFEWITLYYYNDAVVLQILPLGLYVPISYFCKFACL